mgnify:CR=1 FL=1
MEGRLGHCSHALTSAERRFAGDGKRSRGGIKRRELPVESAQCYEEKRGSEHVPAGAIEEGHPPVSLLRVMRACTPDCIEAAAEGGAATLTAKEHRHECTCLPLVP